MAQVRPVSRWFEQQWRPRLNLAAKVLRDIEARWLLTDRPFPCRSTAAVLLWIFAFDFYSADFITYEGTPVADLWRRTVEEWFATVGPPEGEFARLSPHRSDAEYKGFVESVCTCLDRAADSWAHHAPDKPSCEEVTREMLDELAALRFVVIPHV